MSPTANTRDTRDRMIVSGTNTWLILEDVYSRMTEENEPYGRGMMRIL